MRIHPGFFGCVSAALILWTAACSPPDIPPEGTAALRAALVDSILVRVERRDAFSEVKNRTLGFDPLADMRALRADVVAADDPEALFYALTRLSHARRDRHLHVALVPGGLQLPDSSGIDVWGGGESPDPPEAPVRLLPDFGPDGGLFVSDVAKGLDLSLPAPGDRVLSVNGLAVAEWEEAMRPWIRHSAVGGLRWRVAQGASVATAELPPALRTDSLRLEVRLATGESQKYTLPFLIASELVWRGASEPRYPGLSLRHATPTYELLVPDDGARYVVLVWRGFRETMVADVDSLVALAQRDGLLDHAMIVDVTRSRGGSLGPYAIQRLQPEAFKTTFGTLRLSDLTVPFIEGKRVDYQARNINDGGVPETVDDGSWLMDWLESDALAALARGDDHTAPVPFKLAHASKESDGVLPALSPHFRGAFAVISGPSGGSHLDQFNAIVKDNDLGPIIGMPAGGYSNTWEWEETLTLPGTDQPVMGFMYDIGFTIRPNGEVLEGNPAEVDVWLPLTAQGAADYYPRLLDAALERLGLARGGSRPTRGGGG